MLKNLLISFFFYLLAIINSCDGRLTLCYFNRDYLLACQNFACYERMCSPLCMGSWIRNWSSHHLTEDEEQVTFTNLNLEVNKKNTNFLGVCLKIFVSLQYGNRCYLIGVPYSLQKFSSCTRYVVWMIKKYIEAPLKSGTDLSM